MKHRLVDVLRCTCGRTNLTVAVAVERSVPFSDTLRIVKCAENCALRKRSAKTVTPADCNECYTREVESGTIALKPAWVSGHATNTPAQYIRSKMCRLNGRFRTDPCK